MSLRGFIESAYFHPKWYHYPFIIALSPLSILYGSVMVIRRKFAKPESFGVPIVSIGNLIVGGSGKTPFVIALASHFKDVAVVSRGYGRKSTGLAVVSHKGTLEADVYQSGDEAMLIARSLPDATVIVSEDRKKGIEKAIALGAKAVFLDDGFNRVDIEAFQIVLEPLTYPNVLPFPAGPLREFLFSRKFADLSLKEGEGYRKEVWIENQTPKMVLVSAIANPVRLEPYLPSGVVARYFLKDHAYFERRFLQELLQKHEACSILCTSKDRIKMEHFKLPISEMKLQFCINPPIVNRVKRYIDKVSYERKSSSSSNPP